MSSIGSGAIVQSEFPLEAREGIEVVQAEHKQFEGKASSAKLAGSEKPEVGWLAATFCQSEDVGKRNFLARSALTQPHALYSQISSHRNYIINIIIFTEITVTTPQVTRVLARLIGGGINLCGDVV